MTSKQTRAIPTHLDDDGAPWRLQILAGTPETATAQAAPPPAPEQLAIARHTEITFIESNVADLQTLLDGLAGGEVHVLDAGRDGLEQIAAILDGRAGIDALHIISHGATAAVNFGALKLDDGNLDAHRADLQAIGAAMADGGDILLYGCDVAAGGAGAAFIDRLADATGADVAASTNLTGAAALGGDWRLEVASGQIDTAAVVDPALAALYQQTLAIPSATVNFNSGANFVSGGGYLASQDVIYNVSGNSSYQLKINGQNEGVVNFGAYVASDAGYARGETMLTMSFVQGQVFTPTSIKIGTQVPGVQSLVFKGYDTAGNQVGSTQTFNTDSLTGNYLTATFSGLTNIATLRVTADAGSNGGKMVYLIFDDFALTNIQPPAPAVTMVTSGTANGSYKVGDTISVSVTFDNSVTVTGTPQLTLATGGAGRAASYASGSGSTTLTFSYTVQAGDSSADLDYFGTGALTLNGGSITQTVGAAAASLTLPTPGTAGSLSANKALVIDGVAPTVAITSSAASLKAGETATITFTFSENPGASFTWDGSVGDVVVTGGTLGAISGAGLTRTATFTPTASTNAGTASITVTGSSYADTVGNLGGAGATPSLSFDTLAPSAPSTPALASASDSGTSNADGITNDTTPTFSGSAEAGATVRLYDTDGSTLLGTTTADGGGAWTITSSALGAGAHSVSVKASDAAGNTSAASATQGVTIMTAAPGVTITSNVATVKAGETATITFTFSSDPGASFTWDGSSGDVAVTGGTLGAISGSGLTRTATFTPTAATDGVAASITVTGASYQDVAGNNGGAGATPALLVDTIALAPTIAGANAASDSGASSSDGISSVATPVITGHAENGAAVRLYDSDGTTMLGSTTADGAGNWSITSSALSEGAHTLTVRQTDVAGNVSAASGAYSYKLDTTAPGAVALSATTVALANATNGATVATLSATDANTVSYAFTAGNGTNDADNGKFTVSGTGLVAAQNLSAGTYQVYLRATDAAGNNGAHAFTINVVDAPGVASIVRAAAAPGTVAASAASVAYTVTFSQSVTGVDASDFTLTASGTAAGAIQSVTGSGDTYTVTVNGISGDGTLRLDLNASATGIQNGSAVAIVGGHTAGQLYTLDHTTPAAPSAPAMTAGSDTGASTSDAITSDTTPTITGTAEANATVNLYDTGGVTLLGTTTADGSGNWSITSSALAAGSHTLTARATDAAGNVSAAGAALTAVIDTGAAAPTLALAGASDGGTPGDGVTNSATPTITGTAEANAAITLYDTDGVTVLGTATANGSGAWSIAASTLGDGAHTLTAVQTDRAGNVSAASAGLALTIDTAAPGAPGAPLLAPSSDSGAAGDNLTNDATPTVTGTAAANAVVRLYDSNGTTELGTATADGAGNWSITSSTLTVGAHTLTAKQFDLAGNASVAGAALTLTIEAAPVPPTTPPSTIDGVAVVQTPVALPGGGIGTRTVIGIVTNDRAESSGNAGVADIPLATGGGASLLLAQIAPGYGLTASGGASRPAGSSTEQLIQAILGVTPGHPSADQSHLTGNGVDFLDQLADSVPLLVNTIVPVSSATAPTGALTLTGTSSDSQHTALVIDASQLASGSALVLNAIDFAAVVGAVNVTGNTAGQILTGDAAGQQFTVSAAGGGAVFAGGGADTLVFNSPQAPAALRAAGAQAMQTAAADTTTVLHGGLGNDSATFNGNSADYIIEDHLSYVIVTAKSQPQQHALVVNAESLKFADTTLAVATPASLHAIAGLYESVLGRQADHQGIEFWAKEAERGVSLGNIAMSIILSVESQGRHPMVFNGNNEHDLELLYQGIFGRASDAGGFAYWLDKMAGGVSLEVVASSFMASQEMEIHKIGAQNLDFLLL